MYEQLTERERDALELAALFKKAAPGLRQTTLEIAAGMLSQGAEIYVMGLRSPEASAFLASIMAIKPRREHAAQPPAPRAGRSKPRGAEAR